MVTQMEIPKPETLVTDINPYIFDQLILTLNNENSWEAVAKYFKIFDARRLIALRKSNSPAKTFLHEIGIRRCRVKRLCEALEHCRLYDALTLIKEFEPVSIIHQPGEDEDTIYIPLGGLLNLKCVAKGLPPPKYQWCHENIKLVDQNECDLQITTFEEKDRGAYSCLVTQEGDELVELVSNTVNVEIHPVPPCIQEEPEHEVVHKIGDDVILSCRASAYPDIHYQWYHENTELVEETRSMLHGVAGNWQNPPINAINEWRNGPPHIIHSPPEIPFSCNSDTLTRSLLRGKVSLAIQTAGYACANHSNIAIGNSHLLISSKKDFHSMFNVSSIKGCTTAHQGFYKCYISNSIGGVWTKEAKVSILYNCKNVDLSRPRARATEKVALLIGNDTYEELCDLGAPSNDVMTIAEILKKMNFKVIALQNLTLIEMRNAVRKFCEILPQGGYGVFYFAGHGFEMRGKQMLPVDAPGPECYKYENCYPENELIRDALRSKPRLLTILLDMCLKAPSKNQNSEIHNSVPPYITYEPSRNLMIQYATTSNLSAYERKTERNGIYVKHLKNHLGAHLPIDQILALVQKEIANEEQEAAEKQMPLSCTNVVEDFYLTDPVVGNAFSETLYNKILSINSEIYSGKPVNICIKFGKINKVCPVSLAPHRGCFLNSMDVCIFDIAPYIVDCRVEWQEIQLDIHNNDSVAEIKLLNLQKTRTPVMMSILLLYQYKEVDHCVLNLEFPLIAAALMCHEAQ